SLLIFDDEYTQKDNKINEDIPEIKNVVSSSSESSHLRYQEEKADSTVMGINQAYIDVQDVEIKYGRNLVAADFLSGSRAAIVSESIKDDLLEDGEDKDASELLGMVMYVNSQPLEIVGVLEEEDDF